MTICDRLMLTESKKDISHISRVLKKEVFIKQRRIGYLANDGKIVSSRDPISFCLISLTQYPVSVPQLKII